MGQRGPQPKQKFGIETKMSHGQDVPARLGTDAARYWKKHAPGLIAAGLLTGATEESFIELAVLYGRLCALDTAPTNKQYLDVMKAFVMFAKHFRLLPTEQPAAVAPMQDEQAEFKF